MNLCEAWVGNMAFQWINGEFGSKLKASHLQDCWSALTVIRFSKVCHAYLWELTSPLKAEVCYFCFWLSRVAEEPLNATLISNTESESSHILKNGDDLFGKSSSPLILRPPTVKSFGVNFFHFFYAYQCKMHSGHVLGIVIARLKRQHKWTHHSRVCLLTLFLILLSSYTSFHYVRRGGSLNPSLWAFADELRLKCYYPSSLCCILLVWQTLCYLQARMVYGQQGNSIPGHFLNLRETEKTKVSWIKRIIDCLQEGRLCSSSPWRFPWLWSSDTILGQRCQEFLKRNKRWELTALVRIAMRSCCSKNAVFLKEGEWDKTGVYLYFQIMRKASRLCLSQALSWDTVFSFNSM